MAYEKQNNEQICRSLVLKKNTPFSRLFEQNLDAQFVLFENKFIDCNQKALELFKVESSDVFVNVHPSEFSPLTQPDGQLSSNKADVKITQCYEEGVCRFPWVHRDVEGHLYPTEVTLTKVPFEEISYIHATVRLTDENSLETALEDLVVADDDGADEEGIKSILVKHYVLLNEYKKAIDRSSIVSKTDVSGNITYVNNRFCEVSGYSREELLGQPHSIISHPETPKSLFADLWETIRKGNVWHGIIQNKKKSGESYYVDSTITPIIDAEGEITEFIAIRTDITTLYEQQQIIMFHNTDELTGLPNRAKLLVDLKDNKIGHVALVKFLQISRLEGLYPESLFKSLLQQIATRLSEHFESIDFSVTVYKISHSEFAILCDSAVSQANFEVQIETLANGLSTEVFDMEDVRIPISARIGWCSGFYGSDRFQNAKLALLTEVNKDQLCTQFDDRFNRVVEGIAESIDWTSKLRKAIKNNSIVLFGQSIFDIEHQLYSKEILMRYYDEESGSYKSPAFFLEYAKKSQLYPLISRQIIRKGLEYLSANQTGHKLSINVTYEDLIDTTTRDLLLDLIRNGKTGGRLVLELVESEYLDTESEKIIEFLNELKKLGVKIAIDDFGTGYSNFDYFTRLPIDIVKIDGSLIKDIDTNDKHFSMVQSIVKFCKELDIEIVAEFVENDAVLSRLSKIEVDYYQGYYFHAPEYLLA